MQNVSKQFQFPKETLEGLGVAALYIFGSRAQDMFGPLSDFDFAVLMNDPKTLENVHTKTDIYTRLYSLLEDRAQSFAPIDIIFLDTAPLNLQYQVVTGGEVLFAIHESAVLDFKQRVFEKYADFSPIREEFQRLTLERIL